MQPPDSTAVVVALWRAAHLLLDDPPHVLEDRVGLQLPHEAGALRAAGFPVADDVPMDNPGEDWLRDPRVTGDLVKRWRATVLARARFVEDLVDSGGVGQYVILGAGLDSFALRRADLTTRLTVFEVDEPHTQQWKRDRLHQLAIDEPSSLSFVPVDFESGESWLDRIVDGGFDLARPAVVSSLGVTQYITADATHEMMRLAARLAGGTTFVCTFVVPARDIEPAESALRTTTEERAAAGGHPWISSFTPGEMLSMSRAAGFDDARHVAPDELTQLYFSGRTDGLRPSSSEHLLVATARC